MGEIEELVKLRDMLEQDLKDEEGMEGADPTTLEEIEDDLKEVEARIELLRTNK